ncbi:hypothetical protein L195_g026662 [Trifolium pratense]|uniref:Uncharacterized protein n=1 Tax=Trifolium pratense TaxID=57577 RepID=A0A2K3NJW9_TRIPR|nr:hypothetical protein L195_g026662 [Trifolium pratense]
MPQDDHSEVLKAQRISMSEDVSLRGWKPQQLIDQKMINLWIDLDLCEDCVMKKERGLSVFLAKNEKSSLHQAKVAETLVQFWILFKFMSRQVQADNLIFINGHLQRL